MFFNKKEAKKAEAAEVIQRMGAQRDEIKRKLKEMADVNIQLDTAVKETQEISVSVIKKLSKELKMAKKSITSVCSKLKEGIILVDSAGAIIQLNASGEALFGIESKAVVGRDFSEVVEWLDPSIDSTGEQISMQKNFFTKLSNKLVTKLKKWDQSENRYLFCNCCLKKELPAWFDLDNEIVINAFVSSTATPARMAFSFSILDNDPESLKDIVYIFIFRRASPDGLSRRHYEQATVAPTP